MASAYPNLLTTTMKEAGLADFFLVAHATKDFTATGIKCPVAPEKVLINVAHGMAVGSMFAKVAAAPMTNTLESKMVGEPGSISLLTDVDVFILGASANVHQWVSSVVNEPLIILIKDANCSVAQWYQLGCDCLYAYVVEGSFKSGTTKDGRKGWMLKFRVPQDAIKIYTGVISINP